MFVSKNCIYFFKEATWTTKFFFLERFKHCKKRSLQKLYRNMKKRKFLSRSGAIREFFPISHLKKTAFSSFQKSPEQRIFSLLIVSNILSHEAYRKFYKNCQKLENFYYFFDLRWSQPKNSKNLHETKFLSLEIYGRNPLTCI